MAATSSSTDRKSCSRKNKMKKLLVFVTLAATGCGSLMEMESAEAQAEKPLLKVAIMSDIQGHSYAEDAGMRNLERALDIFAVLKPQVVVNDGDINDTGRDSHAVAYYKKRCDERLGVLPHIACMGNHEIGFVPKELQEERSSKVCLKEFNSIFGFAADEQLVHRVIEGYDFIALSLMKVACYREHEVAMLEKALEKAVKRDSKKPIFVATHYHVKDTVGSSDNADQGGALLRRLFDKFPQVVSISGHTHNPLQDPRCIWQGNFTAVDSSTLCYGCVAMKPPAVNQISCLIPYGHESVGVMFLEVYVNRLVFRRFPCATAARLNQRILGLCRGLIIRSPLPILLNVVGQRRLRLSSPPIRNLRFGMILGIYISCSMPRSTNPLFSAIVLSLQIAMGTPNRIFRFPTTTAFWSIVKTVSSLKLRQVR